MRNTLIVLASSCLVLGIITNARTRSHHQEESKPVTLQGLAEQAKAKGKHEVTFPTGATHLYGIAQNVDEALSHFSLVVAVVVGRESYVDDSQEIRTWYKFKIVETLRRPPNEDCSACQVALKAPEAMLPLGDDEFLVLKDGGTVVIDGVKITSFDPNFPDLSLSGRYMLFVSLNPATKVNALGMGPHGIYEIDRSDVVEPILKRERHPLHDDLKARLGRSVNEVRSNIRNIAP